MNWATNGSQATKAAAAMEREEKREEDLMGADWNWSLPLTPSDTCNGYQSLLPLIGSLFITDTEVSWRLAGVVVRWGDLELLLVALYLPAQPENRAPFYRDCLEPFLSTLPKLQNVMVMGDLNVVEDPALDKSSCVGSAAENRRLMGFWANTPLTDVFRFTHPGKREYTFHMKSKGKLQEWLGVNAELDGEATTGFLSGKVKVHKAKTEMSAVLFKGKTHLGAREVLAAATDFFKDSFGGRGEADASVTEPVVMNRTLCDASRAALSVPWSEEEVRTAVRELAPGKSPGQDGLPKELFEHNWDLLGPVLMKFVGDFTRSAELPREISTAVTILLHKKGSKEELGNYRPITLLSTVYKVLAKVMVTRLNRVLHEVISEDQVGFLPGRKLADAVAVVADAVEAGASGGEDWFLLMVDFQKAFDSISRPFLFRTLRGMGIPENFVSWAKGLHTGAGTRLHINGWTGDRVAVERGVRQGCPLAPYLFLCAVEPLCQEFARRRLGVGDGGAERLAYLGYADDTSLLLNGEEQLAVAAEVLENFGEASGLKVNKDKTVVFPLGVNRGRLPPADLQYKWADKDAPERLLGVWITPNGDPLPSWKKALERARKELAKWEIHHLTTSARVTIINGYISPIFMFQAYIYPPPEEIWSKIKATEEKAFILWNYELVCTRREEGGLGMICPKKRFESIAVQNVGRMMLQANPIKKWLTERAAALPLGPDTIYAHQSLLKHWAEGSKRWKDMVQAFWKSPFCVTPEPENRWEVERERLAFNRRIPFRGASPFGNQKGSACLLDLTMGDLIWRRPDGSRGLKDEGTLVNELGSVEAAKLALKAFGAAPARWRELVLEPLTSEEFAAKVPLLRYQRDAASRPTLWKVTGTDSGRVTGVMCQEGDDGTFTAGSGRYPVNFGLHSGEPVAAAGNKALGVMGETRTKLLQSKLCKDGVVVPLKEIRTGLVSSAGTVKEQRSPPKGFQPTEGVSAPALPAMGIHPLPLPPCQPGNGMADIMPHQCT
ncbi:unnamed protein product [Closterium sp. Yama58-4]|nr:unnamed protein product [Closterium sp. Yama58-4]